MEQATEISCAEYDRLFVLFCGRVQPRVVVMTPPRHEAGGKEARRRRRDESVGSAVASLSVQWPRSYAARSDPLAAYHCELAALFSLSPRDQLVFYLVYSSAHLCLPLLTMSSSPSLPPSPPLRVLIANRGEIACRIARAVRGMGGVSVGVYAEGDEEAAQVGDCEEAYLLPTPPHATFSPLSPYLSPSSLLSIAIEKKCNFIHPGYGFLSESAEFVKAIESASLTLPSPLHFLGPSPSVISLFGDKIAARNLAAQIGVPITQGTMGETGREGCTEFAQKYGYPVMLKALFGGGGKGMRIVRTPAEMDSAYTAAASEAKSAFGREEIFVEVYLENVRHIEVQLLGDSSGDLIALGERDCTLQQRQQKVLEIAPCFVLTKEVRKRIIDTALVLGRAAKVNSVTTVEFLLDLNSPDQQNPKFYFMECNPRIQVEHTITEEVHQVDLIQLMIQVARGELLKDLLPSPLPSPPLHRASIQARITAMKPGLIVQYHPPRGVGVRIESGVYTGYTVSPAFDPVLLKVICTAETQAKAMERMRKALRGLVLEGEEGGLETNVQFLIKLVDDPRVEKGECNTAFIQENIEALQATTQTRKRDRRAASRSSSSSSPVRLPSSSPLPPSHRALLSPLQALVVSLAPSVRVGGRVRKGDVVVTVNAMKIETSIRAEYDGVVVAVNCKPGDVVQTKQTLIVIDTAPDAVAASQDSTEQRAAKRIDGITQQFTWQSDLDAMSRHVTEAYSDTGISAKGIARQRKAGKKTVRERIRMVVERPAGEPPAPIFEVGTQAGSISKDGSFTPGNFLALRSELPDARPVVIGADDFTVLGGHSDGMVTAMKQQYVEEMCRTFRVPMVRLLDGSSGGGSVTSLLKMGYNYLPPLPAFPASMRLLCEVPIVSLLLGSVVGLGAARAVTSHFSVAVRGMAHVFVAGPPIVEQATHEKVTKEELGGMQVHGPNGTVDSWVDSEAEAMFQAHRFLSYLPSNAWELAPRSQRKYVEEEKGSDELLSIVPRHRQATYSMRRIIELIVDRYENDPSSSFFEIGTGWAMNLIIGFARIRGYSVGILASDCRVLGGALDARACEKARRFLVLCETFHIPILNLVDMPGFAVGRESERDSTIRRGGQLIGAFYSLSSPLCTVVIRRVFGIAGAAFADKKNPLEANMRISWPSGDWGSLPLEGGLEAAFKGKLAALTPDQAQEMKTKLLDQFEEIRQPIKTAQAFGIEEIIDPRDTRNWVASWIELAYRRLQHGETLKPRSGGYPL
jgi:acetyl/propionyl-CoA carboxylase alpha subunit/acetyl-CoA carboxylase carboxyltransferase component